MDARIEKIANGTLGVIQKNINVCREEFFKVFPNGDDEYFRDIEGRIEDAIDLIQDIKTSQKEAIISLQEILLESMNFGEDDRAVLDVGMVLFLTCGLVIRSS
jgi:hypothetical protein